MFFDGNAVPRRSCRVSKSTSGGTPGLTRRRWDVGKRAVHFRAIAKDGFGVWGNWGWAQIWDRRVIGRSTRLGVLGLPWPDTAQHVLPSRTCPERLDCLALNFRPDSLLLVSSRLPRVQKVKSKLLHKPTLAPKFPPKVPHVAWSRGSKVDIRCRE